MDLAYFSYSFSDKVEFCPKLYGKCAFLRNFHTRKLREISVFFTCMDWSFYWWGGGVSPISDFSSIIFKSCFMVGIGWERKNVNTPYFVYEEARIRSLFLFLVMNNMWRFWCDALAVVTKWINVPKRNYYFWIINLLYSFKQLLFIILHYITDV